MDKIFGKRFCTYCGKTSVYYHQTDDGVYGECACGNIDYCDNETADDVRKRFGKDFIEIDSVKNVNVKKENKSMEKKNDKMTNVMALDTVLNTCADLLPEKVIEKLTTMRDGYSKKSVSKAQLARRDENQKVKEAIMAGMEHGKWYSIPELYEAIPALAGVDHGRVARIVSDAHKQTNELDRKESRGRAYYRIPSADEVEEQGE